MKIDFSQVVTSQEKVAKALLVKRSVAISRYAFCNAIADLGVVSDSEAVSASKGEWPSSMNAFLAYLTPAQSRDAQIEWAACATVERLHPFVLTLGSWLQLTEQELDNIFGIQQ